MKVDERLLKKIKDDPVKYKSEKLLDNKSLKKEFYTGLKKYEESLNDYDSYAATLWLESNEKQLRAREKKNNIINYNCGQILLVDLGWNTYNNEFSFIHPVIVIKNTTSKIFVVPCTSCAVRKNSKGKKLSGQIEGTVADGFKKNSVVKINEARYINKNRVISDMGSVTKEFYSKVYDELHNDLFESKSYEISILEKKYEDLKNKIEELEKEKINV